MEFEYFEYKFAAEEGGRAQRIASVLAEQGYQSLHREALDLVRRYLPGVTDADAAAAPLTRARTVDVLVPASDRTARILVCERPGTDAGPIVAVVAVARSQEEAHRARTAAKLALNAGGTAEDGLAARLISDSGRGRAPRFREEWARALGLGQPGGQDPASSSTARSFASAEALFALQGAPEVLGRPSLLRSRLDKGTNGPRAPIDPAQLDALTADGLVHRSFVLLCRETGQIIGVGETATEVQAAMQVSLRCPHCRRSLSEESQDVVYSLSPQGEEFVKSSRWLREAVASSLRKRNCEAILLADTAASGVDAAASYKDAVLLFRLRDGAPAEEDLQGLQRAGTEFGKIAPGVPVRSVVVATQPAPAAAAAAPGTATVVVASQLDDSLDRLLEELKRDTFSRLTGTTLEVVRTDPSTLLR